MGDALTIILAVLGSTALSQLIQFFVKRHDEKKGTGKKLETLEKVVVRGQLLLLVLMTPIETQEILTVAKYYFCDLHGDWYLTSIFNNWLVKNHIAKPEWFTKGND